MLLDLKKYKLAKILVKDLTVLIKEYEDTLQRLRPYLRYKPVSRTIGVLREELSYLKAHKTNAEKTVANKGQEG